MSTEINPYSKFGYLAIGKETTEGTAVKPSIYLELLSENIIVNYNRQPVQPISGRIDMINRSVEDKITVSGTIVATIDPKNVGYFLNNFFGSPTTKTLETGKVYQHTFEPQAIPAIYTIDVKPADDTYVKRYISVKITSLEISQADNKMQVSISIMATKAFTESRITTATVSATQFHVDQTTGLTTSDVVEFRDRADPTTVNGTASVSTVSGETIVVVGTANTASIKDFITIRKSNASYDLADDLIWIGGGNYGDGDDLNNSETDNCTEDASFTFARDGEERHCASGDNIINRFPKKILLKGFSANGSFQHYYQSPKYTERLRQGEKTALRCRIKGDAIATNSAQASVLLIGSIGDASAVRCTSSIASETSNNLNVVINANTVDTLTATKTGNNIVVKKASTDTTKNTATLVASAINALTGITSAADGAGSGEVAVLAKSNLGSGTNTQGRNANEKEELRIDLPDVRFQPFNANNSEDNLIQEEINYIAQYDTQSTFTTRVVLRNDVTSY